MIKIKNLFFCYNVEKPNEQLVLRDINLEIKTGEHVIIAGNNNSGKTTLLKLIAGHLKPLIGHLEFEDKLYSSFNQKHLSSLIGVLGDNYKYLLLDNFSVIDNLYMHSLRNKRLSPIFKTNKEKKLLIIDNIKTLGLDFDIEFYANKFINEIPHCYRLIVALLAVTLHSPKIILVDNFLNNISSQELGNIVPILVKILFNKNITSIVTSHNPFILDKFSARVLVLNSGEIVLDKPAPFHMPEKEILTIFNQHLAKIINEKSSAIVQQVLTNNYDGA